MTVLAVLMARCDRAHANTIRRPGGGEWEYVIWWVGEDAHANPPVPRT